MSYRTCAHLKEDGALCQSPALRGKKLCFYHHRDHQRQQYLGRILRQNDPLRPTAPLPKTLTDMQNTLYEIITAVANDGITIRRAGKLLYALQQHATAPRKAVS
ncbi:MAG TPA: hypothetical protein VE779_15175 [Candidatus Angelobacter sp.]|nr:hypothetical protein [Candidatus Angelobacter sp.]